jgi:outer membrane murein-binding lipoprotein Lpp
LEEIGKLKDKLAALESRMKEMRAEVERANMEAQINHEEGKKQYHEIAEAHLTEFKKFYEDKLKRL